MKKPKEKSVEIIVEMLRYKKQVLYATLFFLVISVIYSFLTKSIFESKVVVLQPTKDQSFSSNFLSGFGTLGGLGGVSLGGDPNGLYIGILKSTTLKHKIIEEFNLMDHYNKKLTIHAIASLDDRTIITSSKETNFLTITYKDTDKVLAQKVAMAYVKYLKQILNEISNEKATINKEFYEKQIKINEKFLSKAEAEFKKFQQKTGMIEISAVNQLSLEEKAQLNATLTIKETELNSKLSVYSESNPVVKGLRSEINSLKQTIRKKNNGESSGVFKSTTEQPVINLEYLKKLRQVKYHEAVHEILIKQYEISRIETTKSSTIVQVLDDADIALSLIHI